MLFVLTDGCVCTTCIIVLRIDTVGEDILVFVVLYVLFEVLLKISCFVQFELLLRTRNVKGVGSAMTNVLE